MGIKHNMKNRLIFIAGLISLGVGWIGIFLPLLPTTPFLLMAGACFYRSSPKMHRWLINQKRIGPYLTNYENKQMARRDKQITLTILWIGILFSAWVVDPVWLKILLLGIAVGVTWHLSSLKSI